MRVDEEPSTRVTDLTFTLAERGASKLSTVSTTASENQTILGTVPPEEVAGPSGLTVEEKAEVVVPMSVEQPELDPSIAPPLPALERIPEPVPEPISELVVELLPERQPEPEPAPAPEARAGETQSELAARIAAIPRDRYTNIITVGGKIIIEELDTPATRREKASRRKAEKAAAAATTVAAQSQARHEPSTRNKGDGHESDLSSLSELESEEEGGGEAGPKKREPVTVPSSDPPIAGPSTAPQPAGPGAAILPEDKIMEGGTLGRCCYLMDQRKHVR